MKIKQASTQDIPAIQSIAFATWPVTYGEILSEQQLDYMLDLIYSESSLRKQMINKKFIILFDERQQPQGFASYFTLEDPDIFKLDKLYVFPKMQGSGSGKALLNYVIDDVINQGATALRLNVNIHNKAKSFYEKNGFSVIGEADIDIGNGYFMNDFIMQRKLMC